MVFKTLPEDLNADIPVENEDFLVASLQVDQLWSYLENNKKSTMALDCYGCKNSSDFGVSSR